MDQVIESIGTREELDVARTLMERDGKLPPDLARSIMDRKVSDQDQARMHVLARRNQAGKLTAVEKAELTAMNEAGTILSIMKSMARQSLGIKLAEWTDG